MSKEELIEFLKSELELDVEYGHDATIDIQLKLCGEVIDTVEIDVEG